jgi:hypothetical protein
MPSRRSLLGGLAALPATALAQGAAPLGQPQAAPLLSVSGRIGVRNRGNAAVFDMAMIEALGLTGFTTVTPWFDGPVRFDGVPMARLMDAVGATGEVVTAIALNDYSTDIPVSDFARFGVLLATKRDGQRMPVAEKGPLFIVYPYDSNPDLRARQYYSRSAWSVAQLVVK